MDYNRQLVVAATARIHRQMRGMIARRHAWVLRMLRDDEARYVLSFSAVVLVDDQLVTDAITISE